MSLRHTLRIYKGCPKETFLHYVTQAADVIGGKIYWGMPGTAARDLRFGSQLQTHSLYLPFQWTDSVFCMKIGELSRLHWIELRIQEGSIWDYAMFRGATVIDKFSVCPQYWEGADASEEYLREWQGHPEVLAAAWDIPVERIARYLVNWGYADDPNDEDIFHFTRQGLAYPTDRHPYGDEEQFFDFLHALGAVDALEQHTIVLPSQKEYLATQHK